MCVFFFSSRRRHTRCSRDWSSDVCSSDLLAASGVAQQAASEGPYKVLKTAKVSGDGGFDCVYANDAGRRLFIPRTEQTGARITVFDLDTLAPVGTIANASARGAAGGPECWHGVLGREPGGEGGTKK